MSTTDAARPLPPKPTTPDELHAWLKDALDLQVPRRPVLTGNTAPFDYLCFSFFGHAPDTPLSDTTDCVVWANRGGGKTFLGAVATLLDLLFRPEIEVRILAGSLDQSRRMHAHLRRFFDPREHEALAAEVDGKITDRRLSLKNGSTVELLAQSQTSVRGTRVQKLRCDEVDLFDPDVWDAAQLTTRSKRCGEHDVRGSVECLSTMHIPHGVMHRLIHECHEAKRALFRWGVVDVLGHCGDDHECTRYNSDLRTQGLQSLGSESRSCPLLAECKGAAKLARTPGHITIDDAIAQKRRVPLAVWESEMLCLRPRRTNAVLPEFDPRRHVFAHEGPPPHTIREWALGMDFGYKAPTAIIWCAITHDNVIYAMDERVLAEVVLDEHIAAIRAGLARDDTPAWPPPAFIAPDPAGFARSIESGNAPNLILQQHAYALRTSRAQVLEGVQLVRARLAPATGEAPRLYIHKRCKTLIESLEKYHYNPSKPEDPTPVKDGHDHAIDALRYLVQALDKPSKTELGSYTSC